MLFQHLTEELSFDNGTRQASSFKNNICHTVFLKLMKAGFPECFLSSLTCQSAGG
jgi:hypothetical protein